MAICSFPLPKGEGEGRDDAPMAGREGYHNALSWTMEHLKCHSEDDQAWVFGKTATSLFKFAG
jgi:hypothetical protein